MNKRSQNILRVLVMSAAGLASVSSLAGCESLRQAAGVEKSSPDEFAVLTKAPLIIPPDYNLRPPSAGAAPINQQEPTAAAETAMFGTTDPQTAAAGMTGNYSAGEKLLMANAGVQNASPGIRAELQSDENSMQGADESFTDKLLSTPDDNGHPVDADAEANKKLGPSTEPKGAATIQKDNSWFDWF